VFSSVHSAVKDSKSVKTLIAGPIVLICNECVELCQQLLRRKKLPTFPTLDELPDKTLLESLRFSSRSARDFLKKYVDTLRARRVRWATIGRVLGVSRQAAWQRFS
jgi:ATP-dependent protease Clp ATPase subunit